MGSMNVFVIDEWWIEYHAYNNWRCNYETPIVLKSPLRGCPICILWGGSPARNFTQTGYLRLDLVGQVNGTTSVCSGFNLCLFGSQRLPVSETGSQYQQHFLLISTHQKHCSGQSMTSQACTEGDESCVELRSRVSLALFMLCVLSTKLWLMLNCLCNCHRLALDYLGQYVSSQTYFKPLLHNCFWCSHFVRAQTGCCFAMNLQCVPWLNVHTRLFKVHSNRFCVLIELYSHFHCDKIPLLYVVNDTYGFIQLWLT